MTDYSIPPFKTMLDALPTRPLKALELAKKAHFSVNQLKYEIAGIACGVARALCDNEDRLADFYDEDFWRGRLRISPSKLLLHVFVYIYGSHEGSEYKRASEHACALKRVYLDRDIEVADIPAYIADHGGFDALLPDNDDDGSPKDEPAVDRGRQIAARHIGTPATKKFGDDEDDDDDRDAGSSETDEQVQLPARKVKTLERENFEWMLLPREYIVGCIIIRPANETVRDEVLKAIRDGKTVTTALTPGTQSPRFELYPGGGGFIEVLMDDFTVE